MCFRTSKPQAPFWTHSFLQEIFFEGQALCWAMNQTDMITANMELVFNNT
jgi:hypothetical protein